MNHGPSPPWIALGALVFVSLACGVIVLIMIYREDRKR